MSSTLPRKKLSTFANAPAGIRLSWIDFCKVNRRYRNDLALRSTVLIAGIAFLHWPLLVAGLLLLISPSLVYYRTARTLRDGHGVAAKLISTSPPLIAVFDDMGRSLMDSSPCVTVVSADHLTVPPEVERGERVAVTALGLGGDSKCFGKLEIGIVDFLIQDKAEKESLLESISDWQWDSLDEALFDLPSPLELGIHMLATRLD